MGKFIISCDETSSICDKNQYGEATFSDKIKMLIHLLKCKGCQCYSNQNAVLTKVYNEYANKQCKKEKHLSDVDKRKLADAVKEKMK